MLGGLWARTPQAGSSPHVPPTGFYLTSWDRETENGSFCIGPFSAEKGYAPKASGGICESPSARSADSDEGS